MSDVLSDAQDQLNALWEQRDRICAALEYEGEDWLEKAVEVIEAHLRQKKRQKLYQLDTIGGRLRCARELAGMTQRDCAKRAGMHWQTLVQCEAGRGALPAVKVPALCIVLRIQAPWLLCASDEGGPKASYGILKPGSPPAKLKRIGRRGKTK